MVPLRLDKMLVNLGWGSRREIAALARAGKITVNGEICKSPERKIDPEMDKLIVDGASVQYQPHFYLMLHKPAGVVSATQDNFQPTVLSLLPERLQKAGVFPVGRLDKDTEGLLLLTTDGAFSHALTAPRRHIDKVYRAQARGVLEPDAVARFAQGLTLEDGTICRPATLAIETQDGGLFVLRITLREGKFHQVKRMVRAVGGEVTALCRLSIGTLTLDPDLPPGAFRELTAQEVQALKSAAGEA